MHDLVQIVAGGLLVEVRPELVDDAVTMHPVPGLQGEELDQRSRLAQPPGAVGDRLLSVADLEPTQQLDLDGFRQAAHSLWTQRSPDADDDATGPRIPRISAARTAAEIDRLRAALARASTAARVAWHDVAVE